MKDLTSGSEVKLILLFTLPMLVGNAFQQLYNLVDTVIVGRWVGKEALGAVGQAFPVIFISVALVMGFGMAANVLIAQYFGAGNRERVQAAIDTTLVVVFRFALVVTVAGLFLAPAILRLMGTPADVMDGAVLYLRIIFAGFIPSFGYNAVSAILRGLGDSRTPLYALIIATLINIALDLVFVLVCGWGIAGVGVATVIAQLASFIWTILYLRKKNRSVTIRLIGLKMDQQMFKDSLRMGLPAGIQQALVGGGLMALTAVVNSFGTNTVAAFSAVSKLDAFVSMPAMNIGMAVSTFTGQNLGAGRRDRVSRGLKAALAMAMSITVFLAGALFIRGDFMIALFSPDSEVIRIGSEYLKIVALGYVAHTLMFAYMGVVRGAGETVFPMLMSLLGMWVIRIPLANLLSRYWGTAGIWWAITLGFCASAAGSILYYLFGPWYKKVIVRPAGDVSPAVSAGIPAQDS